MMGRSLPGLLAMVMTSVLVGTAGAELNGSTVPLYSAAPPAAIGTAEKDIPTLTLHLAPATTATATATARPAIVILPGGGYAGLSMEHEGANVAKWLNSIGVSALILKYRLPTDGYRHPVPLQDAQRAMRLARANAAPWGLDPQRIGVLGFSAGGHLASTLATHYDRGHKDAADQVERESCRPDFAVLGYPVITMKQATHGGSRDNLLGPHPDPALIENLSNETQVTADTPPTFLLHTTDDESVPVANSLMFYEALVKAGVPAELHIYQHGVHGCGVYNQPGPAGETWIDMCARWLQLNHFAD